MSLDMIALGQAAQTAARQLRTYTTPQKNRLMLAIAEQLAACREAILAANAEDLAAGEAKGMTYALLDRLNLQKRLDGIIADVRQVATLPDPVGEDFDGRELAPGLRAFRRRVPIGVLGVIYESRPNVTVDISSLALKTGNAVILRGGSETLGSNLALVEAIQGALSAEGFPAQAVQLISDPDRKYVGELLKMHRYVDMIIPRGGAALHEFCRQNSTIPVIIGGIGICHLYLDPTADLAQALKVIHNAKTRRPSVCNSLDTLLLERSRAAEVLPPLFEALASHDMRYKLDPDLRDWADPAAKRDLAGEGDWDTEWMDYILGIKLVDGLEGAIAHIEAHGSGHSDGILSQDPATIAEFLNRVDAAALFVNASTGFHDGGALGMGAEVAISTQKLHARGPMALPELTTYKWIVEGDGHIRST